MIETIVAQGIVKPCFYLRVDPWNAKGDRSVSRCELGKEAVDAIAAADSDAAATINVWSRRAANESGFVVASLTGLSSIRTYNIVSNNMLARIEKVAGRESRKRGEEREEEERW